MKTNATIKLMSRAEIIVIGIARMNSPRIPPTNKKGAKLKAAVKVAATIARPIFLVAREIAFFASLCFFRWVSIASVIMIVSSTISDNPSTSENSVIVFSVYPMA